MKKYLYEDLYCLEDKHWWHVSKRRIVQNIITNYNKIKNPKILDVGCGTGKNIEGLLNYGEVWGLDNSLEAIRFCKKRGLKNIKQGKAESTGMPSNSFDIITLLDVLEHTDDKKTLIEMGRILKKNGYLVITVPAFSWLWSKWDEVLHHKRRYDIYSLKEILKSNGFSITYISYLYSFLVLPILIIRRVKALLFTKEYASDFKLSSSFLNQIFNLVSKLEFFLAQILPIPFGTTIITIVKNEK